MGKGQSLKLRAVSGMCLPRNEADFMPRRQTSPCRLLPLRELPKDTDLLRTAWVTQQLLGLRLATCHSFVLVVPKPGYLYVPSLRPSPSFPDSSSVLGWPVPQPEPEPSQGPFCQLKARGGKKFSPSSCFSLRENKLKIPSTVPCILLFFF